MDYNGAWWLIVHTMMSPTNPYSSHNCAIENSSMRMLECLWWWYVAPCASRSESFMVHLCYLQNLSVITGSQINLLTSDTILVQYMKEELVQDNLWCMGQGWILLNESDNQGTGQLQDQSWQLWVELGGVAKWIMAFSSIPSQLVSWASNSVTTWSKLKSSWVDEFAPSLGRVGELWSPLLALAPPTSTSAAVSACDQEW